MNEETQPSMLPQPPGDIEAPPEVHPFYRAGPLLLIPGSICTVLFMVWLAGTLEWSDLAKGALVSATMMIFMIPVAIVLTIVQTALAATFMSGRRRAWWRTWLVLSPAAFLVLVALFGIVNLFPPERRAKRELVRHLGGPVPASVDQVRLTFEGGIDPSRQFDFILASEDFETIQSYRSYGGSGTLQAHIPPNFYYLRYDPASRRCMFRVVNY